MSLDLSKPIHRITLDVFAAYGQNQFLNSCSHIVFRTVLTGIVAYATNFISLLQHSLTQFESYATRRTLTTYGRCLTPGCIACQHRIVNGQGIMGIGTNVHTNATIDALVRFVNVRLIKTFCVQFNGYDMLGAGDGADTTTIAIRDCGNIPHLFSLCMILFI